MTAAERTLPPQGRKRRNWASVGSTKSTLAVSPCCPTL